MMSWRPSGSFRVPGHDVIVFHLLDPDELEFPFEGPSELPGHGNRGGASADSGEAAGRIPGPPCRPTLAELKDRFTAGQVDYAVLDTSKPLDHALFRLLLHREKRSRVR